MSGKDRHEYELVYILQPEMSEENITSFNERVSSIITTQDGELMTVDLWGKRALAYPIKNNFEGHYVLQRFQMAPYGTDELERLMRFSDDALRYMVIRTDE